MNEEAYWICIAAIAIGFSSAFCSILADAREEGKVGGLFAFMAIGFIFVGCFGLGVVGSDAYWNRDRYAANVVLTKAAATEQALLFTPTPTPAPYATSVRATAQAMRESALATLHPEGTPTP